MQDEQEISPAAESPEERIKRRNGEKNAKAAALIIEFCTEQGNKGVTIRKSPITGQWTATVRDGVAFGETLTEALENVYEQTHKNRS